MAKATPETRFVVVVRGEMTAPAKDFALSRIRSAIATAKTNGIPADIDVRVMRRRFRNVITGQLVRRADADKDPAGHLPEWV